MRGNISTISGVVGFAECLMRPFVEFDAIGKMTGTPMAVSFGSVISELQVPKIQDFRF